MTGLKDNTHPESIRMHFPVDRLLLFLGCALLYSCDSESRSGATIGELKNDGTKQSAILKSASSHPDLKDNRERSGESSKSLLSRFTAMGSHTASEKPSEAEILAALSKCAVENPSAAISLWDTIPQGRVREQSLKLLFREIDEASIGEVLITLEKSPDPDDRVDLWEKLSDRSVPLSNSTLSSLVRSVGDSEMRKSLYIAWAAKLKDQNVNQKMDSLQQITDPADQVSVARNAIIYHLGSDLPGGLKLMNKFPQGVDDDVVLRAAGVFPKQSPAEATGWLFSIADSDLRRQAAITMMDSYIRTNVLDASRWLDNLPPGPEKDHATISLLRDLLRTGDRESATRWANEISDESVRDFAMKFLK